MCATLAFTVVFGLVALSASSWFGTRVVAVFAVTLAAVGYALVQWHPAVLGLGAVVVLLLAPPNLGPLGELVAWVQGALESWFSGVM